MKTNYEIIGAPLSVNATNHQSTHERMDRFALMEPLAFDPQNFWDNLLSRQPKLIQMAYNQLDDEEQQAVTAHLKRMAEEDGWHPEQVISARSALEVILLIASDRGE